MHSIGVSLLAGLILVGMSVSAKSHSISSCNSHGEKLSELLLEKAELNKEALIRTRQLLEMKQDLAVEEVKYFVEDGYDYTIRMKELNKDLEEDNLIVEIKNRNVQRRQEHLDYLTNDLLNFYRHVFLFESALPLRTFTAWLNCLSDLREQHVAQTEWPPGYEEMPLLLREMRRFQAQQKRY